MQGSTLHAFCSSGRDSSDDQMQRHPTRRKVKESVPESVDDDLEEEHYDGAAIETKKLLPESFEPSLEETSGALEAQDYSESPSSDYSQCKNKFLTYF